MRTLLLSLLCLVAVGARAQTNVVHSVFPLDNPGTLSVHGTVFNFISNGYMTNAELNTQFTNSASGGVVSFTCDPTNTTVVSILAYGSGRFNVGTNTTSLTNQPGDAPYGLFFYCNQHVDHHGPPQTVPGTTVGLKP